MMQIKYSPARADHSIEYTFSGESIKADFGGRSDTFNFSTFPDGVADVKGIQTNLAINPVVSAKRVNGELFVELLSYHAADATENERYPEWQVV